VAGELGFPVLSLLHRFFLIFLRTLLPCARTTVLTRHIQNYFTELANSGWYSSQCPWDRIALLALYIARIRDEVFGYTDLWNIYTIRADNTRPNHVSGKPFFLYRHPKNRAQRYTQPVDLDLYNKILKDCEYWGKIHTFCRSYNSLNVPLFLDINEYLPPTTLN
jgi:hypothetical protein